MLLALPESEFIVKLLGKCYHEVSKKYCLVFPFVEHTDIRDLKRSKLKLSRIRAYVYKVLQVRAPICRLFRLPMRSTLCIEMLSL